MYISQHLTENIHLVADGEFRTLSMSNHSGKGILTYICDKSYINEVLSNAGISCIVCSKELVGLFPKNCYGIAVSENPSLAFFLLHNELSLTEQYKRARIETKIHPTATINPLASIAPYNVNIGAHCVIEEFASIKENTTLEDHVTIRATSVIGGEGFQVRKTEAHVFPIAHCGGVKLNSYVDIHSHTAIDKGLFPWQDTIIDTGTVVDNLVHIAHACQIGKRCLITAGAVIGGSTIINDDAYIGTNATVAKGMLENRSRVSSGAVVTKNVLEGETVSGNFAIEHSKLLTHIKSIR